MCNNLYHLKTVKSACGAAKTADEVIFESPEGGGEGGGRTQMKVVGMLVVSFRGVNFGFWSHLGCTGQNAIIFSREGLVSGSTRKKIKIYI